MEEYYGKQYIMESQEYFDDYLVFLGMGYLSRKAAINLKPVHCLIRNEDGSYTFTLQSVLASSACTFIPGEEFEETKADGVKVKAIITFEDNTMRHIQVETNGRTSIHEREFFPSKLVVKTTAIGFDKTVTRVFRILE